MNSDEHQQVFEAHQAMKGLMLLMDEHSDLSVVKAPYLYFLMQPIVMQLERLLYIDGRYKTGDL